MARLQHSLARGRLAHAYLFRGPRGAGKAALAQTLAQALNCARGEPDACGECAACRRIASGTHPDVHWVRPESKSRRISVAQIREFEKRVNLRAAEARVKVGIIVDADCLGEEASNAFLKTLEEPPAQTILLLLSAEPQRLIPTILSRCLKVSLGTPVADASPLRAEVVALLREFAERGDRSVAATYRLHAALTGLLQKLRQDLRASLEAEADLDRYAELEEKVQERLEQQLEARLEGEYRAARGRVLEEVYAWLGDVLLCVEQADPGLWEHPAEAAALRRAATGLTAAQALRQLDALEQVREALQRNISEPLALEVGLLKLAGAA